MSCSFLADINLRGEVKNDLIPLSDTNIVERWDDISKELAYANEMLAAVLYIFMMIYTFWIIIWCNKYHYGNT